MFTFYMEDHIYIYIYCTITRIIETNIERRSQCIWERSHGASVGDYILYKHAVSGTLCALLDAHIICTMN